MSQALPTLRVPSHESPASSPLLSDEAFEQLYDLVALCSKRPLFTVEGELVLVLAPGGAHTGLVQGVTNALIDQVQDNAPQRYWVYQERNIRLSPTENPIAPDIAVYDRELRYTEASPVVIPLVAIEVGLSTTQQDHTIKGPRYARAGVAELWLMSMPDLGRCPLTTSYLLDHETHTYQLARHAAVSPNQGLALHTVPLQVTGEILNQSLHRYGVPLSELENWQELPAPRTFGQEK